MVDKSSKVQKSIWFEQERLDFLKREADKHDVTLASWIKVKLFGDIKK